MKKKTVALVYGGKSAEHEVSIVSARNVFRALDKDQYEIVLIGIDKGGCWRLQKSEELTKDVPVGEKAFVKSEGDAVALVVEQGRGQFINLVTSKEIGPVDVVFPVLHGPHGEDGTVQGVIELSGIPYVGCGVLSSAVCMDKEVAKRLLRDAGVSIPKFLAFSKPEVDFTFVRENLGLPVFVKPSNLGSSVGISRASDEQSLRRAVEDAFRFDRKIIIEEEIKGQEIECSVLGNRKPEASCPGEIIPAGKHGFYSYEAKYLDDNGAALLIPAHLPEDVANRVRAMAVQAYSVLGCEGMARVDFFVKVDTAGKYSVYVNELNTIPGFTSISMYPKMWEASGLKVGALLDRLIELAFDRDREIKALASSIYQ